MIERTFGWIQNPSDFSKLKNVVSVFMTDSDIYKDLLNRKIPSLIENEVLKKKMIEEMKKVPLEMDYRLLKGHGPCNKESRSNVKCSGIIQAAIPNQKRREYSDDWTADGFLRWAISIGLLDYNIDNDTVSITELGKKYILADDKKKENEILVTAFLSYPPAVRILNLLESGDILTKFEIGKQLGGLGEAGFTSIPQDLYIQAIETTNDSTKSKIRSNTEGSADKYARMICSWLLKVGLVQKVKKEVKTIIGSIEYKTKIGHSYKITLNGLKELKRTKGVSSYKRISKIVYWQMLATKGNDRDYIRNRRGYIIKAINNRYKKIEEIQKYLKKNSIEENIATINDEIQVLIAMGLSVKENKKGFIIDDTILKFEIPVTKVSKTNILELKDNTREKLVYLDHRYLSLFDLAYDDKASRDFEIQTIDLLINELQFKGLRLGERRKPDGIISYGVNGVIIDNKAYSKGYNLPIRQADEMIRYIQENQSRDEKLNPNKWWENFEEETSKFNYLFISSKFISGFKKNLQYIADRTGVNDGAINVENLLCFAEMLKSGKLEYNDFFNQYNNDEIIMR